MPPAPPGVAGSVCFRCGWERVPPAPLCAAGSAYLRHALPPGAAGSECLQLRQVRLGARTSGAPLHQARLGACASGAAGSAYLRCALHLELSATLILLHRSLPFPTGSHTPAPLTAVDKPGTGDSRPQRGRVGVGACRRISTGSSARATRSQTRSPALHLSVNVRNWSVCLQQPTSEPRVAHLAALQHGSDNLNEAQRQARFDIHQCSKYTL